MSTNEELSINCYNKKLQEKIPHYSKHPQMMPFIGKNWKQSKKLLIIGESHYLRKPMPRDMDIQEWYKMSIEEIKAEYQEKHGEKIAKSVECSTNTSKVVEKYYNNGLFKAISTAIIEVFPKLKGKTKTIWKDLAFMNYFQRPSNIKGKGIQDKHPDAKIANEVLGEVIEIINPNFIFFVSSKSHKLYADNKSSISIGGSAHPRCSWWNRESDSYNNYSSPSSSKKLTGKESFKSFIKKHRLYS